MILLVQIVLPRKLGQEGLDGAHSSLKVNEGNLGLYITAGTRPS